MATQLLSLGADPNFSRPEAQCVLFSAPLEIAISNQDRTMVEILLKHGADPGFFQVRYKPSPLLIALQGKDISLVHLLFLHGASWHSCDPGIVPWLPLEHFRWFVQESGYSPLQPADEGHSLIELVRKFGVQVDEHEAKIKILLEAGAS